MLTSESVSLPVVRKSGDNSSDWGRHCCIGKYIEVVTNYKTNKQNTIEIVLV